MGSTDEAHIWQASVWDKISEVYLREIDSRFASVVAGAIKRAELATGDNVLDLGTGTGSLAIEAAAAVGPEGSVLGVDLSLEMLAIARRRTREANITFVEGRAEQIPAENDRFDAICSSLCFQYVIDRRAAALECARILRPGGRFVAAVWGGPDETDIVLFQATAGRLAPPPPVTGVGPGALADPSDFLDHLRAAGIDARVETEITQFVFPNFEQAWETLAGVTTASLPPEKVEQAKRAVREAMWPDPNVARTFSNTTQFLIGIRA